MMLGLSEQMTFLKESRNHDHVPKLVSQLVKLLLESCTSEGLVRHLKTHSCSSYSLNHLSSCPPIFLSSRPPVFMSSRLHVLPSSCPPIFLSSHLPVLPSSRLPVLPSSCPPFFLSFLLPVILSSCRPANLVAILPQAELPSTGLHPALQLLQLPRVDSHLGIQETDN